MAPYDELLPELTDKERAAMKLVDVAEILGTPEERIKVCCDAAIRFFRERNEARDAARLMWSGQPMYLNGKIVDPRIEWPWLVAIPDPERQQIQAALWEEK